MWFEPGQGDQHHDSSCTTVIVAGSLTAGHWVTHSLCTCWPMEPTTAPRQVPLALSQEALRTWPVNADSGRPWLLDMMRDPRWRGEGGGGTGVAMGGTLGWGVHAVPGSGSVSPCRVREETLRQTCRSLGQALLWQQQLSSVCSPPSIELRVLPPTLLPESAGR